MQGVSSLLRNIVAFPIDQPDSKAQEKHLPVLRHDDQGRHPRRRQRLFLRKMQQESVSGQKSESQKIARLSDCHFEAILVRLRQDDEIESK